MELVVGGWLLLTRIVQPWSQIHRPGGPLDRFDSHFDPGWGEGWVLAMEYPGVETKHVHECTLGPSTNIHGHKPISWGSFRSLHPRNKRSYKRAQIRANRDGYAW